jgi:hypothetical protein
MKWKIEYGLKPNSALQETILAEARRMVEKKNTEGHLPLDMTHLWLMLKREMRKLHPKDIDFYLELTEDEKLLIKKTNSEPVNTLAIISNK